MTGPRAGILGHDEISRRVSLKPGHKEHIGVIPLRGSLIMGASLDVRLGHWFKIARRTRLKSLVAGDRKDRALYALVGQERVFIGAESPPLLLHPGDFVLGCTLEFISLPADVMAFVEGKSGLGRQGLLVATATQVAPGFHGVIVLELANTGTVPLELAPGLEVAQLVLQTLVDPVSTKMLYKSQFYCQTEP